MYVFNKNPGNAAFGIAAKVWETFAVIFNVPAEFLKTMLKLYIAMVQYKPALT